MVEEGQWTFTDVLIGKGHEKELGKNILGTTEIQPLRKKEWIWKEYYGDITWESRLRGFWELSFEGEAERYSLQCRKGDADFFKEGGGQLAW
jgi:hypothetical protein